MIYMYTILGIFANPARGVLLGIQSIGNSRSTRLRLGCFDLGTSIHIQLEIQKSNIFTISCRNIALKYTKRY